jgi:hypothetical protein
MVDEDTTYDYPGWLRVGPEGQVVIHRFPDEPFVRCGPIGKCDVITDPNEGTVSPLPGGRLLSVRGHPLEVSIYS